MQSDQAGRAAAAQSQPVGVSVERVTTPTADVRRLVRELDRELGGEYLPQQRHGLSLEAIFQPPVRFFIARLDGLAIGCGGIALFPEFAEVKRMYVQPDVRGRGVAQALLAHLELEAARDGWQLLRLETGDRQFAAMRLYERAGFRRCEAFGAYRSMPLETIATSIFFEKRLASGFQ